MGKSIALRIHVFLCAVCRSYRKQLQVVCNIARQAGASPSSHGAALPAGRRRAMQDAIDRGH